MNTKRLFLIIISFLSVAAFSQKKMKEKQDQIKAIKVAFITNELNLTADEAAKFWPIYNTFEDKQLEVRKTKLKGSLHRMNDEKLDNITENEASTLLSEMESAEENLFQLKKKFNLDIRGILPAAKILKLKKSEDNFNRKLLQQFKEKRNKR